VIVAKDAQGLKQALVADAFSPIKYDGVKDKALLDEDRVIGAMKLHIPASNVTVTPITDVFAK
jgi:zinc protease